MSFLFLFVCIEMVAVLTVFKRAELHLSPRLQSLVWLLPIFTTMPVIEGFKAYRQIKKFSLSKGIDETGLAYVRYPMLAAAFHCYISICAIFCLLVIGILSQHR